MKTKGINLVFALLISMSVFSFVSAATAGFDYSDKIEAIFDDLSSNLEPILKFTLGSVDSNTLNSQGIAVDMAGDILLIKLLLFIVMLSVLYFAVEKVPVLGESGWTQWTVSVVVAILGARLLTTEALINFVWLPSGSVAIALTCLLPFVVYFYFLEGFQNSRVIRRFGWSLFIVVFFGLAFLRWGDLAHNEANGLIKGSFNLGWFYIITAFLGIISFVLDGTIQKWFAKANAQKSIAISHNYLLRHLRRELADNDKDLRERVVDRAQWKAEHDRIKAEIDTILRTYSN